VSEEIIRVRLFVPCAKRWTGKLDVETEWIDNDGEFGNAFSFGTVERDVIDRIDAAPGALVVYWPVDLRAGREQIVAGVEQLREQGAIAVRIEQSKLGWEVSRWIEIFSNDNPVAWHRGAVVSLQGKDGVQSCGMHAFSLPDVQIGGDPRAAQELGMILNVYQLAEDPMIQSGQTFSPDRDTPRRLLERWPDLSYPSDSPCHNPYGVWRVGPPGGKARDTGDVMPVFVPALRVLLQALEDKAGKPLTRAQVETVRDDGACVAMEARDAQRLERERGYADLDPELVWEQWKAVRSAKNAP
jgi:hypothetical protein